MNSLQGAGRRFLILAGVVVSVVVVVVVVRSLMTSERTPGSLPDPRPAAEIRMTTDCSQDVTESLNRLVAQTPDGGTVALVRDGCYRLDGSLLLNDRQGLTIEGNGATLDGSRVPGERERRHIRIRDGKDLTLRDFTILGSRCGSPPCEGPGLSAMERQHGVAVENVDGMTIERLNIVNVWGDFVYISQKGDGDRSADVVIQDNYFRNSGRQGIAPSGVAGLEVRGNILIDAGRTVFDFEAEGGGAIDVVIADNDIVRPDNATLNVGCADRETGRPLNEGPIALTDNRIYQGPLEVDTACGGQEEFTDQLNVVVSGNEDNLTGEPEVPPWAAAVAKSADSGGS